MRTDRPPSDLTNFVRRVLAGLSASPWTILSGTEIAGGGLMVAGITCHPQSGELKPFVLTEGDGG